jgi:ElaB/YqjD/DUF883 family membrane-anchored ribosome-binding protein
MDERDDVKREAETARKRMNQITGELSERTKVGRRMKTAARQKTAEAKSFLASHPVAIGVTGGLIGLALGALIPVGRRERSLLARLEEKIDALTAMDDDFAEGDDSELSPEPSSAAGIEDELDAQDEDDAEDDGTSRMPS